MKKSFLLLCLFLCPSFSVGAKEGKIKPPYHELTDKKFLKTYKATLDFIQELKPAQAVQVAQEGIKKHPNSPRLRYLIGVSYKVQKKYEQAISFFRQAAVLFNEKNEATEKAQSLYNLAFCFELKKDFVQAKTTWQQYAELAVGKTREATHLAFAQKRIVALQTVIQNNK